MTEPGFLGTEPVGRLLVRMSAPSMIAMLVNSMYNLVDTVFVGQGVGTEALAALAVCFPIQMFILAAAQTAAIGSASVISRALGSGDTEKAGRVASASFLLASGAAVLICSAGLLFMAPILSLFGARGGVAESASEYISVIYMGGVFFALSVNGNNLLRAEGKARIAMTTMITGAVSNMILDPLFIFVFKWGIRGAAVATVLSQMLSFACMAGVFLRRRSSLAIRKKWLVPRVREAVEVLSIGAASFARVCAGSLMAVAVNRSIVHFGSSLELAVFGVINRVLTICHMPVFGLVQGLQPVLGFNYGARLGARAVRAVILSMSAATVITSLAFVMGMAVPEPVLSLFSRDPRLLAAGPPIFRIITAAMLFVGAQITGASIFQTLGRARLAFLLSVSRQVLFVIPLVLLLPGIMENPLIGVWSAFPLADFLSFVVTGTFLVREIGRLRRIAPALPPTAACG